MHTILWAAPPRLHKRQNIDYIIYCSCFIYWFEFAYFFMLCILFHCNLMIFETPIPRFLPRKLSQVSRHGDVHRHLETRKHETPGGDSGGEGEDGPEDHVCKSNKHVAVPSIFQASDDGFLKNMLIFSEPRSRFAYINIHIHTDNIDNIDIDLLCFPILSGKYGWFGNVGYQREAFFADKSFFLNSKGGKFHSWIVTMSLLVFQKMPQFDDFYLLFLENSRDFQWHFC